MINVRNLKIGDAKDSNSAKPKDLTKRKVLARIVY